MNKKLIVASLLSATLALPLTACGGGSASTDTAATTEAAATETAAPSEDAIKFYAGQWRGSVEITGETVYGTAGGTEAMLDVIFAEDGTVEVKPLEAHADLLTDTGTWTSDDKGATLHLSDSDITLTKLDEATLTANAADFGIDGFDTIQFDFYG